jgi:hypothetical protein
MLGRERQRLAEAEVERLVCARLAGPALRLVGDEQDRFARASYRLGEMPIDRGETGARVDEKEDRVTIA